MNAVEQRNAAVREKVMIEITKMQRETKYPAILVPDNFRHVLNRVLATKTTQKLQCSWEMMRSLLVDDVLNFSLEQMGIALNAIEVTSPHEYACTCEEYIFLMDMQEGMAEKWHEIRNPLVEQIKDKHIPKAPLFIPHGQKKR